MLLPLSRDPELSPNRRAIPFVNEMIEDSTRLCVDVSKRGSVTVIDCGVHTEGGYEAGILFSKVCLGGFADVNIEWRNFDGLHWPAVRVVTDHPVRACMASQFASWPISLDGRTYMGSGPACAVIHRGPLFKMLGYEDVADVVILCLESTRLPDENAAAYIAAECGCEAKNLYILVAPTASVTGTVQVAARAMETAIFKMRRIGYNLGNIVSGAAVCPISSVARDAKSGLGRTNDAISYGSDILLNVRDEDKVLREVVPLIPSSAAPGFGRAYTELNSESNNFFLRGPDQFNPASLRLCNLRSGNVFCAGRICGDVLRRSFGIMKQH